MKEHSENHGDPFNAWASEMKDAAHGRIVSKPLSAFISTHAADIHDIKGNKDLFLVHDTEPRLAQVWIYPIDRAKGYKFEQDRISEIYERRFEDQDEGKFTQGDQTLGDDEIGVQRQELMAYEQKLGKTVWELKNNTEALLTQIIAEESPTILTQHGLPKYRVFPVPLIHQADLVRAYENNEIDDAFVARMILDKDTLGVEEA